MIVIAYRYRAYSNAGQRELFARHFGCKRKVFNLYLEEAHRLFQKTGSILSAYAFIKKLPAMKRTPELKYLAEVNSQSLQSAVLNAAESFEFCIRSEAVCRRQVETLETAEGQTELQEQARRLAVFPVPAECTRHLFRGTLRVDQTTQDRRSSMRFAPTV